MKDFYIGIYPHPPKCSYTLLVEDILYFLRAAVAFSAPLHDIASILPLCLVDRIYVAGGVWAIIFSWAAWKRSWAGRDPTYSITASDRSVAITGNTSG